MRTRFDSARAAMLLLLALLFPFWGTVGQLWADNVTASQARQQAQAFLSSRIAAGAMLPAPRRSSQRSG